jgi:hypothetical protein
MTLSRHVDWRLLPLLGCIYALALVDRGNRGVARVVGAGQALVRSSPYCRYGALKKF